MNKVAVRHGSECVSLNADSSLLETEEESVENIIDLLSYMLLFITAIQIYIPTYIILIDFFIFLSLHLHQCLLCFSFFFFKSKGF